MTKVKKQYTTEERLAYWAQRLEEIQARMIELQTKLDERDNRAKQREVEYTPEKIRAMIQGFNTKKV